jgi:methionine sulfoxide reductase heme-binding subunit
MPTAGTTSAATGVISMTLLTGVVVLGILVNRKGRLPGLPRFSGLHLHRYVALLAVAFLALHILTAIAVPFAGIGLAAAVIPFASARDSLWIGLGAVSFDLLVALVVTSLLRRHIGWRVWRAVHWLAYLCWPVALAHGVGIGPGMRYGRLLDLTAACIVAVVAAAAWRLAGTLRGAAGAAAVPPELSASLELITPPEPATPPEPTASLELITPPEPSAAQEAPSPQEPAAPPEPATAQEPATAREAPAPPELIAPAEPATAPGKRLRVNPVACSGHGLCAELLPELIMLDMWGYPVLADQLVPAGLVSRAKRAVTDCPVLALRLADAEPHD